MKQKFLTLLAGMVLGMALLSGGYAAGTALTATPSGQVFYVDGQQISMTAYLIGGSNYVRLRDIGQAVGFNVYWDGTVQIEGDQPYTGIAPATQAPVSPQQTPAVITEESAQAAINALWEIYPTNTPYGAPYVPNNPLDRPYSNCDHCAGWAMKCSDAAFGNLPWRRIDNPQWEEIRPGDLVEYDNAYGGHVVVVVDKTDEFIRTTESGQNNKTRWGGQYFKWWLEEQPGYALRTRYPQ
jgi:hypothetical protein